MGDAHEILTDWVAPVLEQPDAHRPWSPLQALMEAAPHEDPETSRLELLLLRDVLADALDDLSPRDRRLVEARVIERKPLRKLERELGWKKSHMQRREKQLLELLATRLERHPAIKQYLRRNDPQ